MMDGGGYDEVILQHITICKADKQGEVELFGEVSFNFSMKSISVSVIVLLEIVSLFVVDIL